MQCREEPNNAHSTNSIYSVLLSLGRHTVYHRLSIFFHSSEGWKSKIESCFLGTFLGVKTATSLLSPHKALTLQAGTYPCLLSCVLMSLLIRTQSDWIRSKGFILTLLISLKALSPNSHILRYQGVRLQPMNSGGTQLSL